MSLRRGTGAGSRMGRRRGDRGRGSSVSSADGDRGRGSSESSDADSDSSSELDDSRSRSSKRLRKRTLWAGVRKLYGTATNWNYAFSRGIYTKNTQNV